MRPLALALCALSLSAVANAQTISTVQVASGLNQPTSICSPPGETQRLFVTTSREGIYLIKDGVLLPAMFLDLSAELSQIQGLMGMTFHRGYAANGKFYICYMDNQQATWLKQFNVSAADPDLADPASGVTLLGPVAQLEVIHNWDCLKFGPDGMLYMSTGDGGGSFNPSGSAQDLGSLLGKILRLDVDAPAPYIPPDNPFVGQAGVREEIWAYGLRQPWRFDFDAVTGDFYLGDVGEASWEEIDFLPAGSPGGANFGWVCMQGNHCTNQGACTCNDPSLTDPILEYDHAAGCSIIGGVVYRGSALPFLQGAYMYADHCSGSFFTFRYDGQTITDFVDRTAELGGSLVLPNSFGVDGAGEVYVLDNLGGKVLKLVDGACVANTYCTATPNSWGPGCSISSSGALSVANNTFQLEVTRAVPGQAGVFYYGAAQGLAPFGDGFRCIVGQSFRLNPPIIVDANARASRFVDFTSPPQVAGTILPGSTWNFQFWYRDPLAGGAGFNLSNGLEASFCP